MRHRACATGTVFVASAAVALASATPALASPKYQPNSAGNGVTQITGQCGGSPQSAVTTTLVVNNNHSSAQGGWDSARIYGTHDVLVPQSFTLMLLDATTNSTYVIAQQTKGSTTDYSVNCFFYQPATDPPQTAQDLVSSGELTVQQLPAGVALSDLCGLEVMVEAAAPNGTPFAVM